MSAARRVHTLAYVPAALFGLALGRVAGFFTDDSYIHLVFARNLVRGLGFSFNPGETVYGFTSPLWVLVLGAGHALVPDWLLLARVAGFVFTLLAVLWTYRLARAAGGDARTALVAAGALAFHAWFLRWSLSGMETSLAAFLVALGLERLLRGGAARSVGLAALALAALARPECALLFALGAAWGVGTGAPKERTSALAGIAAGLVALAGWEAWVHGATGSWVPRTFEVKHAHEALSLASVARPTFHFLGVVGLTDAVLAPAALLAAWRLARGGALTARLGLLLSWPAALGAVYLLTRFQMISRYWVPVLPALCVFACVAGERALGRRLAAWAAGLYVAQQAAVFLLLVSPQMSAFSRGLDAGPAAIGRWLRLHAAPSALVATPDIGAVGWYSERRVLDLGGLVTPAMGPVLARHDLSDIVRGRLYEAAGRPDYLVDRDPRAGALLGPELHLVLASRMDNLGISRPRPVFYSLYRVGAAGAGK